MTKNTRYIKKIDIIGSRKQKKNKNKKKVHLLPYASVECNKISDDFHERLLDNEEHFQIKVMNEVTLK